MKAWDLGKKIDHLIQLASLDVAGGNTRSGGKEDFEPVRPSVSPSECEFVFPPNLLSKLAQSKKGLVQ